MAGNLMPVSVSHYYNSCLSDANDYACGKGWKTSAHQKVTREKHNNINYFVWEDGDGPSTISKMKARSRSKTKKVWI